MSVINNTLNTLYSYLQPEGPTAPDTEGPDVTDADTSTDSMPSVGEFVEISDDEPNASTTSTKQSAEASEEAEVSADAEISADGDEPLEGDTNEDGELDPKEKRALKKAKGKKIPFTLKLEGGVNAESTGFRDRFHPWSQRFGDYGDFTAYRGNACIIFNPGEKKLVDLGACGEYQRHTGNQTALGSTYNFFGLGGRAGINLDKIYAEKTPLKGKVAFLSRFGIEIFLGAMIGTGTNNDVLLHNKNGFAWSLNPYLNIVNFNLGNANLGVNANWTNVIGYKSLRAPDGQSRAGNTPLGGPGGSVVVRWGLPGEKSNIEAPVCKEDKVSVPELQDEIANLQMELELNEAMLTRLVVGYLEKLSKYPFTDVSTKKAMRLGQLVELLKDDINTQNGTSELPQEDINKIQNAVKAAAKIDESSEDGEAEMVRAIAIATNMSEEKIQALLEIADDTIENKKIGGLWDLPENAEPHNSSLADVKSYTECDDLEMARGDLEDVRAKLRERKGAVDMAYKHALHLAGLSLGEDVDEVLKATFLRVDSPNYGFARPNDKDVAKLKAWAESHKDSPAAADDAELMKILNKKSRRSPKGVFALNKFEAEKLYSLAQWMNGEGKLPGEERVEKLLTEHKEAQTDSTPQADATESTENEETNAKADEAVEKAYNEWVTKLNLKVVGHTDSIGPDDSNKALSQRRADAIKYMLIGFGVDESRVEAIGAGEGYPIVPEPRNKKRNDPSRIKNRRVEFVPEGQDATSTAPSVDEIGDIHTDASDLSGRSIVGEEEPADSSEAEAALPPPP